MNVDIFSILAGGKTFLNLGSPKIETPSLFANPECFIRNPQKMIL